MKKVTVVCASLAMLAIPGALLAQEAQSPATAPSVSSRAKAPDAPAIEEIVVTAQRRSENIQKVPIAVTAVSEETIQNLHIVSTADLAAVLPGLNFSNSAGSGLIYLRGIGQNSGAPGIVNPISTYLDGVYIGIARLGLFDLNAVSQVSLLRGPQGSLFGRNASGGIIQVATRDPSFDTQGDAQLGYGNFNTSSGALYATGPLHGDNVAANVSLKFRRQADGQIHNLYTGSDLLKEQSYSGQAKLLVKATKDTDVLLNVASIYSKDLSGVVNMPRPGLVANDGITTYISDDTIRQRFDGHSKVDTKIGSLKVTQDLGGAEFSNLAHYLKSDTNFTHLQGNEHAGRPNPNNAPDGNSTSFTKITAYGDDIQITSANDRALRWIAGVSFEHELTNSIFSSLADEALTANTVGRVTSDAWAGFVQGTLAIVPSTRVTAGGRYTRDALKFDAVNTVNGATAASSGVPPSTTFNQVTWRAAVDHDVTDGVMTYVAANRGFKAGQYNITSVTNPPVRPEIVDGYEAGVKSQLFDKRLRLNTAVFLQKATDLQLRATQTTNVVTVILFNAAKAKTYGMDLDFEAALTKHWTLTGGFEWLPSAKYTSFPNASSSVPALGAATVIPSNCRGTPGSTIGGTLGIVCDLTGYRMIFAAKVAGNIGVRYVTDGFGGRVEASVNDSYTSRFFIDALGNTSVDPYHLVSASLSWTSSDEKWNARLWGTNITDAKTGFRSFAYIPGEPRKFGVEVGMKF